MTIELTTAIFGWERKEWKKLSNKFRFNIFEAVSKSDLSWFIFTWVRAFDQKWDWEYMERMVNIFKDQWWNIYFIELEWSLEKRLARNKTQYRLEQKPSKRNIERSEENLLKDNETYRLNSLPWEIQYENYIKIDTTDISVSQSVQKIINEFNL